MNSKNNVLWTTMSRNTACMNSSDTSIEFYATGICLTKGRESVLIMKQTLLKNNLNYVKKYTHDLNKFHYNCNYSCREKIGMRFMYLPNSWNNVKINCNRKVVFTHLITPFPKSRTTVNSLTLKTGLLHFTIQYTYK
jgi:hypothetical protein